MKIKNIYKYLYSGHNWSYKYENKTLIRYNYDLLTWEYSSEKFDVNGVYQVQNIARLNSKQVFATRLAFKQYEEYANLKFIEKDKESDPQDIDILLRQGDLGIKFSGWAVSWFMNKSGKKTNNPKKIAHIYKTDLFFDEIYVKNPSIGSKAYVTVMHEIGHSLGLKHPHDKGGSEKLPAIYDNWEYTVMSYNNNIQLNSVDTDVIPITPMMLDILTLQNIYGTNMYHNMENNVYYLDGYHSLDGNNYTKNIGWRYNYIGETIWDAGGLDTINSENYKGNAKIDLRDGFTLGSSSPHHSTIGKTKIYLAIGTKIENAIAGPGNDRIQGNELNNYLNGNAGNDVIYGDAGNDIIIGGAGQDLLYGGPGYDIFAYLKLDDSKSNEPDIIADFQKNVDKISLEAINLFSHISTDNTENNKLYYYHEEDITVVNSDIYDFTIYIAGIHELSDNDFFFYA